MSLTWTTPVWMWPLLLVLAAGAVIWTAHVYGRTRPQPRAGLGRLLIGLRVAALLLLVLAVAGPVLSRLYRQDIPGRLVFVLEDSASMAIADAGASGAGDEPRSRWDASLDFIARVDSALDGRNWPGRPVFLRGNGLQPLQEFRPDDPVIPDPAGHGTDLNRLLRQASDHVAGWPAPGLILLSDGQETRPSGAGDSGAGQAGLAGGSRLMAVGAGDPVGSADRLIKDLRYPDTAYAGDEIVVELSVTHRFLSGQSPGPLQISLREEGRLIHEETRTPQEATVPLEIPFKVGEEGLRVYELQVSALDNERFLANNKVSLAVNVRRGRSRLLALAPRPGWDLRFLAQAALGEPRVELAVVQPSAAGPVFADSLVSWTEPRSAAEWSRWDGLILLGWEGWAAGLDWEILEQAVRQGLGLLVMPGPSAPQLRTATPVPAGLARLLPIQTQRFRWIDGDFFATIPAGAVGHPVLHLVEQEGAAAGSGPGGLNSLPPLRRILGTTAAEESLILLEAEQGRASGSGVRLPLLVAGNLEQGRALWFGGQRLWELAFWEPSVQGRPSGAGTPQPARRLMQNLLIWLAAGQEESGLVFAGRRGFYQEGERISLAAQWRDMRGQPVRGKALSLKLRPVLEDGSTGPERTFALSRPPQGQGPAEVVLPPLPPGRYAVQLAGEGDPPVVGAEEFLVVTAHSVEETQVRLDRRRLLQLAERGGGEYFALTDSTVVERLLETVSALDWSGETRQQRERLDFWSGWPFLVLVAMLLGLEWYLRRRNGML